MKKVAWGVAVVLALATVLVWLGVIPAVTLDLALPELPQSWRVTFSSWMGDATVQKLVVLLATFFLGSAGVIGLTYKFFLSEGRARFDARRKFTEKVTAEISGLAKSHYWALANYAGSLAQHFERYVDARNQLLLLRWDRQSGIELQRRGLDCADSSFWVFCQLLLRFDEFQFRGSNTYLLTTHQSGELAKKLYNSFIATLPQRSGSQIDTLRILKTLRDAPPAGGAAKNAGDARASDARTERIADLPARAFLDAVKAGAIELQGVREAYEAWLRDETHSIEKAAQSLRAYNELLTHELALLHEQWFHKRQGLWTTTWPDNAISSDSLQTMQTVQFESALLASMPTRDNPRTETDRPGDRKTEQQQGPPGQSTRGGGYSFSDTKTAGAPPATESPGKTRWQARAFIASLIDGLRLRLVVAFLRRKLDDAREYIPILANVSQQVRGIRAAQINELYRSALQAYVLRDNKHHAESQEDPEERNQRVRKLLNRVMPVLRRGTLLELRQVAIGEALLAYLSHDAGDRVLARRHVKAALRYARRAYRRVDRMNERNPDRRYLTFWGSAVAILSRECALLVAEEGRYRHARRLLGRARRLELDWEAPLADQLGTLPQLQAHALAGKQPDRALELLSESYETLRGHGATRMAGRSQFQAAQLLRSRGNLPAALKALKQSYACYKNPSDPLSLGTILEVAAAIEIDRKQFRKAQEAFDEAIELTEGGEGLDHIRARCLACRGVLRVGFGDLVKGRAEIIEAVGLFREQKSGNPWGKFIDVTSRLLDDATRRARVQRLMETTAWSEASDSERARIVDQVMRLLTQLGEKTPNPNGADGRLAVEAPIRVTISEDGAPFTWSVPPGVDSLKRRLADDFGVRVPGIAYRIAADLHEQVYEISIMGIRQRFHRSPDDEAPVSDIDRTPFGVFWAPTRKLFDCIRGRLAEFVGHQEVQNLLETTLPDEMKADVAGFQTHSHISPITTVLQALLEEKFPISRFIAIRTVILQGRERGDSLQETVAAVRGSAEIRTASDQSSGPREVFELAPSFERELWRYARKAQEVLILRAPRETAQRWTDAIRSAMSPNAGLVLRDERLRPLVRELIRLDLPETDVVAYGEPGNGVLHVTGVLEGT